MSGVANIVEVTLGSVLGQDQCIGFQMRLKKCEHGQVQTEGAVEVHQVDGACDALIEGVEGIPNADLDEVG